MDTPSWSAPSITPKNGRDHTGIESQIPWDIIHDDRPRWRTEDDPDIIAAKEAAERREG
jgi:hypothetical protein